MADGFSRTNADLCHAYPSIGKQVDSPQEEGAE